MKELFIYKGLELEANINGYATYELKANDNKTIGLLLCRGKDEVVAQYALAGYDQPIGISDYQLSKAVPENLKSALPSIEEVEEELTLFLDKDKNP